MFSSMPAVVAVHCSEDTSGWHSNPFVAKEICLFFALNLGDTTNCKQIRVPVCASCEFDGDTQRSLDQAKIKISIAQYGTTSNFNFTPYRAIEMFLKAAKLCRVCMAFLIALMASDFSFALRQACNTSKNGKIN